LTFWNSVTVTLVYTYNAVGLRVAQSLDRDVTEFAWDWVAGLLERPKVKGGLLVFNRQCSGGQAWI
jgi:hypothetical protein